MKNQLAEISPETALSVFTAEKGLDSYVQQVKDEVNSFEHDLTTVAGRAKTISLASKVAKIKVKYDDCGKDLVSGWKENAKKVDKARKKMRDDLDELKVIARKPVTDWEDEQTKIEADRLIRVKAELLAKEKANDEEVAILMDEKFERDLADEKARLEAEEAVEEARLKQVQIDNDIRIAKEATVEAERLAQEKIDNAKIAEQKAIDDKAIADAELLASQAREELLNEQAAQEKINNEWLEYISEAYQINEKLNTQAEQKRQSALAETRRLESIETERLAGIERQRIAQEKLDDEEALRMADANNIRLINRAIYKSLVDAGVDPENAKIATQTLIDNKVPHTTINY